MGIELASCGIVVYSVQLTKSESAAYVMVMGIN